MSAPRTITATLLATALTAGFAQSALAASCAPGNIAGIWNIFAGNTEAGGWTWCKLWVKSNGDLKSNSWCEDEAANRIFVRAGGNLKVNSKCKVTGTVLLPKSEKVTIKAAQMSLDKQTIGGAGDDNKFGGFVFTAIKQ
jgi:hypothetical protein